MITGLSKLALLGLFCALACHAAGRLDLISPVTQAKTIFVVQINAATPPELVRDAGFPTSYETRVRAQVIQVLRDPKRVLTPEPFPANLKQVSRTGLDSPRSAWAYREVAPGQKYLVFARGDGTCEDLLESPSYLELLGDGIHSVGDVETILRLAPLETEEQVLEMSAAVAPGVAPHGNLLADYVFRLLGQDVDPSALSEALMREPADAFCDSARDTLLRGLNGLLPDASAHLRRLFVVLTAKYFLAGTDPVPHARHSGAPCTLVMIAKGEGCGAPTSGTPVAPSDPTDYASGLTSLQSSALDVYFPWILARAEAIRILHSELDRATLGRLRSAADVISGDTTQLASRRAVAAAIEVVAGR